MNPTARPLTVGLIVTTRNFFPSVLCRQARESMLTALEREGIRVVTLPEDATPSTGIESYADACACSDHLRAHADEIDGVVVTLPNFGSEKAVADALRLAGLRVPVLIHAVPDRNDRLAMGHRRDSFCGKLSVCSALNQYGIPFSLTTSHTCAADSDGYRADLRRFAATCRVVRGLRNARFGQIGSRTSDFLTVRYSEKLLERFGISVETIDLSEVMDAAAAVPVTDEALVEKVSRIGAYIDTASTPAASVDRIARFSLAVDAFIADRRLAGTAIQCWTALQKHFGIMPCTAMAMMGDSMIPSACETDITGLVSMYALQCASGSPSAIVDWNNNFGEDSEKAVIFHCSNIPASMLAGNPAMSFNEIIATSVGQDRSYGTISGAFRPGAMTYCRVSTDDANAGIRTYLGRGEITSDSLETFGGVGVVRVPNLQRLMHFVCLNGFEHHVAINVSATDEAIYEAFTRYLGWRCYWHEPSEQVAFPPSVIGS